MIDMTTGKMELDKEEVIEYLNNIKEFSKSRDMFEAMNKHLSFEEMAILLTWIEEKTSEGIAKANEL